MEIFGLFVGVFRLCDGRESFLLRFFLFVVV